MENATHPPEEPPRRRGFVAHPVKATALILGVLAFLLFIGFWLISYVNLISFEWDNSRAIKVIALGQGQLSFSCWSIPSFPSFPALAHVEDFHSGHTGNGKYPEIDVGGEYREPRNAIRSLGGSWFYWHHGADAAWIVLVPCWVPVAVASLALLCAGARRLLRRWRQHKPGTCRKCGYDLRASSERCPECGTDISDPEPKRRFGTWPRIAMAMLIMALSVTTAGALLYEHSIIPEPPETPTDPMSTPEFQRKDHKIYELVQSAPTSQPSPADSAELLEEVAHDSFWVIRIRAMAVLPFLHDREKAIDVLIACVHDRDPTANGSGNVPLYATSYLAEMKACRAIPDIAAWVDYLQKNKPYGQMGPLVLQGSVKHLAFLKAPCTQSASQPATSVHN